MELGTYLCLNVLTTGIDEAKMSKSALLNQGPFPQKTLQQLTSQDRLSLLMSMDRPLCNPIGHDKNELAKPSFIG
jgi:hypothetical protein